METGRWRVLVGLAFAFGALPSCRAIAPAGTEHDAVPPAPPTDEARTQAASVLQQAPAAAVRESPWDRYSVSLGYLVAALDTSARFGAAGAGVEINLEDLLGYQTGTSSVRVGGAWRFSENRKHRLDVSLVDLGRSGDAVLSQDVDVGPITLPAGTNVVSSFDIQLLRADYSYSFFQDDRFDLAGGAGLYVAPIDFSLAASGLATYQESFDITAPLPLVGLRMDFAVTPQWYLRSNFSLLYVEVGDYIGEIRDLTAAVEYRPFEHVAFGLGVDSFGLGVEMNGSTNIPGVKSRGSIDFEYTGLLLYLKGLW
jgi:hypothetical protein